MIEPPILRHAGKKKCMASFVLFYLPAICVEGTNCAPTFTRLSNYRFLTWGHPCSFDINLCLCYIVVDQGMDLNYAYDHECWQMETVLIMLIDYRTCLFIFLRTTQQWFIFFLNMITRYVGIKPCFSWIHTNFPNDPFRLACTQTSFWLISESSKKKENKAIVFLLFFDRVLDRQLITQAT